MIELKDFPEKDREVLFNNFEYYSYIIWSKDSCNTKAHKILTDVVGIKYIQELWVVLTNVGKCIRYGTTGYKLSLTASDYSAANKRFNIKVSAKRMKELLCILHENKYIDFMLGFYHKDSRSHLSCVLINDKFINLMNVEALKKQGAARDVSDISVVEVLDTENTPVSKVFNYNKFKIDKMKDVVLKSTKGMKGIFEIKNNLKSYNLCIQNSKITIDLGSGDQECNAIVYKRRFENDLNTCGRYYVKGTFQNLPSEYRPTIKINGEPTTEIDVKNCHPLMLCNSENMQLPDDFDSYLIPKLTDIGITRDIAKSMLFPILFTSSKASAVKAVRLRLVKVGMKHISAEYVIDCFLEHNYFLDEYAYSENLYGYLQYLDSSIATLIINHFTSKGVVVLCYHDSFRIQKKYEDELHKLIIDSYNEVVGSIINLRVSIS